VSGHVPAAARARAVLPIVCAVALLLGLAAFWQADRARHTDRVGNHALVDANATTEVQNAVSSALLRVLTYDYTDPATTQTAAEQVLAGDARQEYDVLFKSLQQKAPGQKLTLSAQVQVAAVKDLTSRAATLLVFLDQASQRATDKQSTVSAAQLSVKAAKIGGTWVITDLKPL